MIDNRRYVHGDEMHGGGGGRGGDCLIAGLGGASGSRWIRVPSTLALSSETNEP